MPTLVKEGDTVLLPQNFSPQVLKINDTEMELIREEDIIAVIHQG
jgi:co-chaperonin GroES (HSP10)